MQFNTYLLFDGNCEEAFKFYEKALGGKIEMMLTHEAAPAGSPIPPEWLKKIMHARLSIGNAVLMASDAPPGRFCKPQGFSVNISLSDASQAERIYNSLAENATNIGMPLAETFWAHRFAMLTDRFGIPWMINCEKAVQTAA